MTKTNSTVISINNNNNFVIDEINQNEVETVLKGIHGIKAKLDAIPIQSMPTNNPLLIELMKEVANLSKLSTKVLTDVTLDKDYYISENITGNGHGLAFHIPKILLRNTA